MSRRLLRCFALLNFFGWTSPGQAVDYFWQNSNGGAFDEFSNWSPTVPPGPGGAGDTVNFDLGTAPESRYLISDVAGETDQLIVHNDSLELSVLVDYSLLSTGGANASLVVGAGTGDTADLVIGGASLSVLNTQVTRIANATDSTGELTINGLQWNGGNLRIGRAGSGTLNIDDDANVTSTNVSIGHLSAADGRARVQGAASWTTTGTFLIGREGDGLLLIEPSGEVTSANVSIGSEPSGEGSVHVNGIWTVQNSLTIGEAGDGTLFINYGGILINADAFVGDLPGSNGFVHIFDGQWSTTGRLTIGGEDVSGTLGGSGIVRISGGDVTVDEEIHIVSGILELEGGFLAPASVTIDDVDQFDFTGGNFRLNQFNGDLVNQGGMLLPDEQVETPVVNGNYIQQSGGISFLILGAAADNLYNSLQVAGTATLGGDLILSGTTLYEPESDEVYTLIEAADIAGAFDNVASGERIENGRGSFIVYYGPGSPFNPDHVVLTDFRISLPGDFNEDGAVDAADYVAWRKGVDVSTAQAQYLVWRNNFGRTLGGGASTNVPEPGSFSGTALLVAALTTMRRHRRTIEGRGRPR